MASIQQLSRSIVWRLPMMLMMLMCSGLMGCLFEPFDGQVVDRKRPISFTGYGVSPDTLVQIRVFIPPSARVPSGWRTVATVRTSHEPISLFSSTDPKIDFYGYSGSFTLPPEAIYLQPWHGKIILGAKVEAFDQGIDTSFYGVRSDRFECYSEHKGNAIEFRDHCTTATTTLEVL